MSRLVALLLVAFVGAQDPTFEVASVKESDSLDLDGVFQATRGRFAVKNLSVRWMLRYAFRLRDYQVIGAPAWTEQRYQVEATVTNTAATNDEVRRMLQQLLADRFALRARREQRPIPLYELKTARGNGTLGPKLMPSRRPCEGGYCLFQTAGSIKGFGRTMAQLTPLLDEVMASPVVDRTGLTGTFDFDVVWGETGDLTKDPSDQTPEARAALLTALREQLGLSLNATRAPYDVLVIESIARPAAN